MNEELIARLDEYFQLGGLFNPEAMEQDKVRDLLRDCRSALSAVGEPELSDADEELVRRLRDFARAYPEDIFLPMNDDDKKHPGTITRASASMGRHFAKWFTRAADRIEALYAHPEGDRDTGQRCNGFNGKYGEECMWNLGHTGDHCFPSDERPDQTNAPQSQSTVLPDPGLTFAALRSANTQRLPQFKNKHGGLAHSKPDGSDWSPAQWLQAVVGELGEYANLRKKHERGDVDAVEFQREAADELADVATYLDILAMQLGVDLGKAIASKFNRVSERVGCGVRLPSSDSIAPVSLGGKP